MKNKSTRSVMISDRNGWKRAKEKLYYVTCNIRYITYYMHCACFYMWDGLPSDKRPCVNSMWDWRERRFGVIRYYICTWIIPCLRKLRCENKLSALWGPNRWVNCSLFMLQSCRPSMLWYRVTSMSLSLNSLRDHSSHCCTSPSDQVWGSMEETDRH